MFRLGVKLQGQRPRNGNVAPFPSLPWPPPWSSLQGPLPHLGTAVSGCVKGSLVPGEPGPHQTHILSIWQGFSLRHLCLGFKKETALSSPWQAKSVLLQVSSSSQYREAGAATAMPARFTEVVSPASLGHSSPTPEGRLLVSQLETLVTISGTWYPHHPVTFN